MCTIKTDLITIRQIIVHYNIGTFSQIATQCEQLKTTR